MVLVYFWLMAMTWQDKGERMMMVMEVIVRWLKSGDQKVTEPQLLRNKKNNNNNLRESPPPHRNLLNTDL